MTSVTQDARIATMKENLTQIRVRREDVPDLEQIRVDLLRETGRPVRNAEVIRRLIRLWASVNGGDR